MRYIDFFKKLFFLIIVLSLLSCDKESIDIPGLVAYFPFNGNANDESDKGYNGTDYGTAFYETGYCSLARTFSNNPEIGLNSTDYVTIPNVINSTEFTINFWAKFDHSDTHQSLIYLSPDNDWVAANFWLEISPDMKLAVIFNGLDLRTIDYTHQALKDGRFNLAYINSKPVEYNKFQNISCTFRNSVVTLYLNGTEYAKYSNVNRVVGNPDTHIKIGVCPKTGMLYYPFVGQMDELRFYNRALKEEEINFLYGMKH